MSSFDPFAAISGSVGILLLVLGYLLKARRKYGLMAGYAQGLISDPKGASTFMGRFLYAMGVVDLAIGVLWYVFSSHHTLLLITFIIANVTLPIIMFLAGDRYRTWPKLWK